MGVQSEVGCLSRDSGLAFFLSMRFHASEKRFACFPDFSRLKAKETIDLC